MYQKHLENIDYINAIYQISGSSIRVRVSSELASSNLSGQVVDPMSPPYETFDAQDCPDLDPRLVSHYLGSADSLGLTFDEPVSSSPAPESVKKEIRRIRRVPVPIAHLEDAAHSSHSPGTPARGPVFRTPESRSSPQIMVTPPTPNLIFSDEMATPSDVPETPKDSPIGASRLGDPIDESSWRPRIPVAPCSEVKTPTGLLPSPIALDPEVVPKMTRSASVLSTPRRPKIVRGGRTLNYDSPSVAGRSRDSDEGIRLLHPMVSSLKQGSDILTNFPTDLEDTDDAGSAGPAKVCELCPFTPERTGLY